MINDIADVINISVSNPAESEYDIFVGLEHYDVGEPIITRYGSTKMLTTACKKFSAGDILLARRNVYLRRAGLVKFDGLTSGDSIVIRIKPNLSIEGVNSQEISRLLPFVLNTNAFWDFANTNSDGTMSKRLSPQMLLSYEFNLPPYSNQKPLADKLWAAYSLKASKLKLIDAIDEMVKSQFIGIKLHLFSRDHFARRTKIASKQTIFSKICMPVAIFSASNVDFSLYLRR